MRDFFQTTKKVPEWKYSKKMWLQQQLMSFYYILLLCIIGIMNFFQKIRLYIVLIYLWFGTAFWILLPFID